MSSSLYVYANITHKKRKVNSRRKKLKKANNRPQHKTFRPKKIRLGALRLGYGELQPPDVRDMHAYTMR